MKASELIVRDIERRIIKGFMDLLILSKLDQDGIEISGYDVIKYLHKRAHLLVSPGTVYPCLYAMEREGLLKGRHNGKKRVYKLARRGRKMVKVIRKSGDRISKFMLSCLPKDEN